MLIAAFNWGFRRYPVMLIAAFNFADLAGKEMPAWGVWPEPPEGFMVGGAGARLAFVPAFYLAGRAGAGPAVMGTLTLALGISNGYFTAVIMTACPRSFTVRLAHPRCGGGKLETPCMHRMHGRACLHVWSLAWLMGRGGAECGQGVGGDRGKDSKRGGVGKGWGPEDRGKDSKRGPVVKDSKRGGFGKDSKRGPVVSLLGAADSCLRHLLPNLPPPPHTRKQNKLRRTSLCPLRPSLSIFPSATPPSLPPPPPSLPSPVCLYLCIRALGPVYPASHGDLCIQLVTGTCVSS
jgi:Nucleoside transporter